MAPHVYSTNSVTLPLVANAGYTRFLGGNGNRVGLTFLVGSVAVVLANRDAGTADQGIVRVGIQQVTSMLYRDWGPIVTGEIYLASFANNGNVTVTEIIRVPRR
jgi:hypothetical protein